MSSLIFVEALRKGLQEVGYGGGSSGGSFSLSLSRRQSATTALQQWNDGIQRSG